MKPHGETSIVLMTKAAIMLAEANTIQKAKELKDLALTAADWARHKNLGEEAIQHCRSYALEAERKIGEMLRATERATGARGIGTSAIPTGNSTPTLSELGLSPKESSRAQMLADVPRETFDQLKTGEKSISSVRREFKEKNTAPPPPIPKGQYSVIYADPPWQYQNTGFDESASQNYPTMPIEVICRLPIQTMVGPRAVLFLWATNPFLKEGIQVCEAWGFQYKTNLVWVKNTGPSMGWFVTSRHELLLIATKGEGMHPKEKPISWFEAAVRKHSQKPELVYGLIEKMYIGPYIELFARNKRAGWESWGNELG